MEFMKYLGATSKVDTRTWNNLFILQNKNKILIWLRDTLKASRKNCCIGLSTIMHAYLWICQIETFSYMKCQLGNKE